MAKKKSKPAQQQQQLSPEKYIRLKARNLSIDKCFVSTDWQEVGLAEVLVSRRHTGGNYTFGIYLVDTLCLGLKDSIFKFNITPADFDSILEDLMVENHTEISYDEAHNIIYGAISYAEDLGIKADKSFDLTQYILEEDTDDIPLIEYEYGRDGSPYLVVESNLEASKYLPALEKSTNGNFRLMIADEEEDDFSDLFPDFKEYPETPYTYDPPMYPSELNLFHQELQILLGSHNEFLLSTEDIKQILSLPRESLIADLQQMVLYMIGQNNGDVALIHALFFLGELRAEEALDTVLEVMRQDSEFMDINFGDSTDDVLGLTLYYVGRNKLPELLAFAKEPGLYMYFKFVVFIAMNLISDESGRREDVLEWYRELMQFFKENATDLSVYSAGLGGLMIAEMLDICPEELLPEIEDFFEVCDVDEMSCGTLEVVKEDILAKEKPLRERKLIDIYERNQKYYSSWCKRLE